MKKNINVLSVYLFTFISFIITILFVYIFAKTAPQFYTGFDKYTSKNMLSIFADILFILLLSVNFIGIVLCTSNTYKVFSNKFRRKN